ncbi:SDR family oxidoreductase [Streptomyces sp. NPDC003077]|uniref:SDR family oxidoreductase n=1 Tax=Streptomyces sp. NPDC003077 TaxID=3154443 RepID=UPI0033AF065E
MSVAVTGATGFLGLHLLRELLQREERVILLARAHRLPASDRVLRFLHASGMPAAELRAVRGRLETVEADVRRPRLGLSREAFQRLADRVDVLWHCAGNVSFSDQDADVRATNVDGTRHVLELLTAGARAPLLCHVSTAAVAGARRHGTVYEGELDASYGFQTPYERSKYDAEVLVRRWADECGGRAAVFRPSGLVTRQPAYPGRPSHPLRTAAEAAALGLRMFPQLAVPGEEVVVPVEADARVNVLPVEHAAYAMVEAPRRKPPEGTDTYHVVHSRDTPMSEVIAAFAEHLGVGSVRLDPRPATSGSPAIRAAGEAFAMYACWARVTRRYDDGNLARLGLACPERPVVDKDYLLACLR